MISTSPITQERYLKEASDTEVKDSVLWKQLLSLATLYASVISVGSLTVVKDRQKVFGVGIFFAGFELPNGILEAILVAQGGF